MTALVDGLIRSPTWLGSGGAVLEQIARSFDFVTDRGDRCEHRFDVCTTFLQPVDQPRVGVAE
jgi:hypothetical protein